MALRVFEGFDMLNSGTTLAQMQNRGWANITAGVTNNSINLAGRFGGKAMTGGNQDLVRFDVAALATAGVMGSAHFLLTNVPAAGTPWRIMEFTDGATCQLGLGVTNARQLCVYRGTTATVIATGTTALLSNNWTYLEFKAVIHNTSGTYEVRINGSSTPELVATGQNTRTTANNQLTGFQWIVGSGSGNTGHDDIYALDTTGAAPFTDYLGEVRVQTLAPSGAGSSTQWTPLSSTNVSNVDDTLLSNPFDQDATYNSSSTAGQIDLFAVQDLSGTPTVYAVAVSWDARKDDAGARSVRAKLKSGATTGNGPTKTMNSSYTSYQDVFLTDPNTAAAWTGAAVNAIEAGYENI